MRNVSRVVRASLGVVLVSLALLGATATWEVTVAQQPDAGRYQGVNWENLLGGHIPEGTRVEAVGDLWWDGNTIKLLFDRRSARWPMRVEIASLPADVVQRIHHQCGVDGRAGWCRVTVRGTVRSKAAHSIAAEEIEILRRQP